MTSTAARFGGEEFVVLLPDTRIDGAQALAENLRSTIERSRIRRSDNQQEIAQITVSFGIARYCAGESANDFVSRDDNALYLSKRLGRNRVTLASERPMRFSLRWAGGRRAHQARVSSDLVSKWWLAALVSRIQREAGEKSVERGGG